MYQALVNKEKKISVIGLGYVGLPIALEFAKHFSVIGYDIDEHRIEMMQQGIDPSKELTGSFFEGVDITFTSNSEDLAQAHFHIIAVPTDIDEHKVPNLEPLLTASHSVGTHIKKGDYVVYESTVYPGCTEEDCIPHLIRAHQSSKQFVTSNGEDTQYLKEGIDFKFGYSPERINPGDKVNTLTQILKIVSANDEDSLNEIAKVYGHIIEAGIYKASSIKVAEAAKVIENIQRDINISLMNELAIIFDKAEIDTKEVIEAAGTKWNFHNYYPGLVGGHCISVDPYFLMHKSKQLGHDPEVIAAGRRINDQMPRFIAKRLVQKLIETGINPGESKVLIMGITFKENVADIRNSKVIDLVNELKGYSINVEVVDPNASTDVLIDQFKISLNEKPNKDYDAIVVAVGHKEYREFSKSYFENISKNELILFDIKGIYGPSISPNYWTL